MAPLQKTGENIMAPTIFTITFYQVKYYYSWFDFQDRNEIVMSNNPKEILLMCVKGYKHM